MFAHALALALTLALAFDLFFVHAFALVVAPAPLFALDFASFLALDFALACGLFLARGLVLLILSPCPCPHHSRAVPCPNIASPPHLTLFAPIFSVLLPCSSPLPVVTICIAQLVVTFPVLSLPLW